MTGRQTIMRKRKSDPKLGKIKKDTKRIAKKGAGHEKLCGPNIPDALPY